MTTLLAFIASALLELAGMVIRPTAATCPPGSWWLATGIQRDGSFACWYDPLTDDTDTEPQVHEERPVIRGRLRCSGAMYGAQDGTRVWCAGGPTS